MKIVMVCLGNICRSPLAEGILRHMIQDQGLDWQVDSAGTSSWHAGEAPHKESIQVAASNGIDITHQRSRQFTANDFEVFDLIIAMDSDNYNNILALTEEEKHKNKVSLLLNYSHPGMNMAVPDPYYSGGFENVFNMIFEACRQLLNKHKVID